MNRQTPDITLHFRFFCSLEEYREALNLIAVMQQGNPAKYYHAVPLAPELSPHIFLYEFSNEED
jgi:hypothetical protein